MYGKVQLIYIYIYNSKFVLLLLYARKIPKGKPQIILERTHVGQWINSHLTICPEEFTQFTQCPCFYVILSPWVWSYSEPMSILKCTKCFINLYIFIIFIGLLKADEQKKAREFNFFIGNTMFLRHLNKEKNDSSAWRRE